MPDPTLAQVAGRIGGNRTAATHDMQKVAARARAGLLDRFVREVDPEGILPPEEVERRLKYHLRAYYAGLQLARLKAAQKKRDAASHGAGS